MLAVELIKLEWRRLRIDSRGCKAIAKAITVRIKFLEIPDCSHGYPNSRPHLPFSGNSIQRSLTYNLYCRDLHSAIDAVCFLVEFYYT